MDRLTEIKSILKHYDLWAKKSFGQNFLIDDDALETIVKAGDLKSEDRVVEVGPGTGVLTEQLLQQVMHVTAVEFDEDMVKVVSDRFGDQENFEVVHSDILQYDIQEKGDYKVIANIPYYITSPLLKHFLQAENKPKVMVVLVQKEVAEKICGLTGKSLITIEAQLFGEPELIAMVPSASFYPAPKVDSAILKLTVFDKPLVPESQMKDFLKLVKVGYGQKRKKLANNLAALYRVKNAEMKTILESAGLNPDCRAEELSIAQWQHLLTKLNK